MLTTLLILNWYFIICYSRLLVLCEFSAGNTIRDVEIEHGRSFFDRKELVQRPPPSMHWEIVQVNDVDNRNDDVVWVF